MSYRHLPGAPGPAYKKILDELYEALGGELAMWFGDKGIIRDKGRLEGGDFFNDRLARTLCESCCMVMIYIPVYFDRESTYCTREYQAMVMLERKRLKLIDKKEERERGLIIPIICRGYEIFPAEIRQKRLFYNFEPFFMVENGLYQTEAKVTIKAIALYIKSRFENLQELSTDPCQDCADFKFPSEKSALQWLNRLKTPKPQGFPLQKGGI